MKKSVPFFALACITIMSCMHHNGDVNITCTDGDDYYSMNADFGKSKMREIEEYMNSKIGNKSNMSFTNTQIDGKLTLDDHTTFYVKKYPGHIKIKLDKDENSENSYEQVISMCQGIKDLLAK